MAYRSQADELFYGGAGGGGKTDLILGLAATSHQRSLILRRTFPNVRGVIDRSLEILKRAMDRYNESLHIWRTADARHIEFGAMQHEKTKENYRGRPYDFYGYDEITEFTESQFRFVSAWNRTAAPGQRTRIVAAGNPPSNQSGRWVLEYWGAWLDDKHPHPAKPGELRWYARIDDKDVETPGPTPITHKGETIRPRSRTFIPALLKDNPFLRDTGYAAILQGLPEPLRSQMLFGDFRAASPADPQQVIPTEWVQLAMRRAPPEKVGAITAIGVDVARGGRDKTCISPLRGTVFDPLVRIPGKDTPTGSESATPVMAIYQANLEATKEKADVNVDVIGVGASTYDALRDLGILARGVNNGAGSEETDRTGKFKFRNIRAASWWALREALDPERGANLVLPDDRELLADLCSPRWDAHGGRIQVEDKEEVRKRLGRSPDSGDAVVLAWYRTGTGKVEFGPNLWD